MPAPQFDHLVVAARDLATGVAWVEERLGVTVPYGGEHAHMATHNHVGQLTPTTFLEIIAINPDDTPDRPRWFSMDTPAFHARCETEGAFLHHWVINTTDIAATLAQATHAPGPAIPMQRGALEWQISVAPDGVLPRAGLLPTVIQWPDIPHPARNMGQLDLTFEGLTLNATDPDGIRADLAAIGADGLCTVKAAAEDHLSARFSRNGKGLTL